MTTNHDCCCHHLHLGMETLEARNWNPDCPVHGVGSEWYASDEQTAIRNAAVERSIALQAEAGRIREARRAKESGAQDG